MRRILATKSRALLREAPRCRLLATQATKARSRLDAARKIPNAFSPHTSTTFAEVVQVPTMAHDAHDEFNFVRARYCRVHKVSLPHARIAERVASARRKHLKANFDGRVRVMPKFHRHCSPHFAISRARPYKRLYAQCRIKRVESRKIRAATAGRDARDSFIAINISRRRAQRI